MSLENPEVIDPFEKVILSIQVRASIVERFKAKAREINYKANRNLVNHADLIRMALEKADKDFNNLEDK